MILCLLTGRRASVKLDLANIYKETIYQFAAKYTNDVKKDIIVLDVGEILRNLWYYDANLRRFRIESAEDANSLLAQIKWENLQLLNGKLMYDFHKFSDDILFKESEIMRQQLDIFVKDIEHFAPGILNRYLAAVIKHFSEKNNLIVTARTLTAKDLGAEFAFSTADYDIGDAYYRQLTNLNLTIEDAKKYRTEFERALSVSATSETAPFFLLKNEPANEQFDAMFKKYLKANYGVDLKETKNLITTK